MNEHEYHQKPGLSQSMLSRLRRSPAHLKEYLDNPKEQTDAMALGSAVHSAVLEPATFWDKYAVAPKCDKRTKEGKAAFAEFEAANQGKSILTQENAEYIFGIQTSVFSNKSAKALLDLPGEIEKAMFWTDEFGIDCKGKLDKISGDIVIDLKTATDASPEAFSKSIMNYGYYLQAAHYLDGAKAARFIIIAVENTPPFCSAVYEIDLETIQQGRTEAESLKKLYQKCVSENNWPGYSQEVKFIGLPGWYLKKNSQEFTGEIKF